MTSERKSSSRWWSTGSPMTSCLRPFPKEENRIHCVFGKMFTSATNPAKRHPLMALTHLRRAPPWRGLATTAATVSASGKRNGGSVFRSAHGHARSSTALAGRGVFGSASGACSSSSFIAPGKGVVTKALRHYEVVCRTRLSREDWDRISRAFRRLVKCTKCGVLPEAPAAGWQC